MGSNGDQHTVASGAHFVFPPAPSNALVAGGSEGVPGADGVLVGGGHPSGPTDIRDDGDYATIATTSRYSPTSVVVPSVAMFPSVKSSVRAPSSCRPRTASAALRVATVGP